MAKSLQDQLLQTGLADKKKANQIRHEKRKAQKQKGKGQQQDEAAKRRLEAQRAKEERAEKDRALARERQEQAKAKEIAAQVRQLIETHRLPLENAETPYQFVDGKKIKRLFVLPEMVNKLARGHLAIVRLDDQYAVVPSPAAQKIRERDAQAIVAWQEKQANEGDEDDPYADYPIPDDLMW
ncbi:DUF2058 domain-containing protein [Marinobacteraceae bacterium S3BR75-40.1]